VVRSDEEKMSVAAKAEKVAGADHVVNEQKIQPAKINASRSRKGARKMVTD
jgi:hypothetical protein